ANPRNLLWLTLAWCLGCGPADDELAPEQRAVEEAPVTTVRHTADQPDDYPGQSQVHLLYVLPSDAVDQSLDTNGTIISTVAYFNTWLASQTGNRKVRIDTRFGVPDITFIRLTDTEATIRANGAFVREALESRTKQLGFNAPNKIYAAYY